MDCNTINYKNIPVQSDVIAGIIELDVDSVSCFRELESLIRSDQGVTTLLLRVVNSPLYSRGRNITTIPLSISLDFEQSYPIQLFSVGDRIVKFRRGGSFMRPLSWEF